jgi:tight adherence protein B
MLPPDIAPILASVLAAISTAGLIAFIFYPRLEVHSRSRKRFEAIAMVESLSGIQATSEEANRRRSVETTLKELEEKRRMVAGASPSLTMRIRQAGLNWSKRTYWLVCLLVAAICFAAAIGAFGLNPWLALAVGTAGGAILPRLYLSAKSRRRLKRFADEFPNAIDVIVRGVKAGLPIVDCLRIISLEAQEPVRSEFRTVMEDQTVGVPLDQAVQRLSDRVSLSETSFFAIVVAMQSRTGGSLSEALGNLSKVLRERKKTQAKIKSMSSEATASAGIIGSLPVVVTFMLYLSSPDYIALLFTTPIGQLVLVACGLWMGIGVLVMRKMINFDF